MPSPRPRPSNEDRIRAALWFAERGFGIFSVWSTDPDGTCRCAAKGACTQPGKHPVPQNGFKSATTDPALIRTMLSAPSEPNWGMLPPEGVLALDVDGEGVARLAELERKHGRLPDTLRTDTAHGQHVFLRWPDDLPRPIGQVFGYVTRWGSGSGQGYVIGPRSVHPSGVVYAPAKGALEIADMPRAWAEAAVAKPTAEIRIRPGGPADVPVGSRHEYLRNQARRLVGIGLSGEALFGAVMALNGQLPEPKTAEDVRRAIGDAERKFQPDPVDAGGNRQERPARARVEAAGIDAADLVGLDLPPLRWIVPDLLPEGTAIVAAAPKIGKSWLVYQIAVEASIGGDVLGRRCTPGSVLYYALEDGQRRGADRLRVVLRGRTMPRGRLEVRWNANAIGEGLEDDISAWLDEHPDAVMVAIDTLGKVRPATESRKSAYDVDVAHLSRLQDVFRDRQTALVIVHHVRKETTDDFLSSVSGTHGITGSVDTTIRIRRKRQEAFGTIDVTGRDIAEAEIGVRFDDGLWTAADAVVSSFSFERRQVYEAIESSAGPIFPTAIARQIGLAPNSVQNMVNKLTEDGLIARVAKGYVVARVGLSLNHPDVSDVSVDTPRTRGTHAREDDASVDCSDYRAHQFGHVRRGGRYVCVECHPEEE